MMALQLAIPMMLLLLAAVLGIRYRLRVRCLGKCAGCPRASICAKETDARLQQNES